jgi:site-specific recombinase
MSNEEINLKAKELVERFQGGYTTKEGFHYQFNMDDIEAKQCALIAVDEILKLYITDIKLYVFWQGVKQAIENL